MAEQNIQNRERGTSLIEMLIYAGILIIVMAKALPGTLLFTSSCSAHVDEGLFQKLLFQAAVEAKRMVRILGKHIQSWDHPISLYHPEGEYLKTVILHISH